MLKLLSLYLFDKSSLGSNERIIARTSNKKSVKVYKSNINKGNKNVNTILRKGVKSSNIKSIIYNNI